MPLRPRKPVDRQNEYIPKQPRLLQLMESRPRDILSRTLVTYHFQHNITDHARTCPVKNIQLLYLELTETVNALVASEELEVRDDTVDGAGEDGVAGFGHEGPLAEGNGTHEHGFGRVVVFDADDGVDDLGTKDARDPFVGVDFDRGINVSVDAAADRHEHVAEEIGSKDD